MTEKKVEVIIELIDGKWHSRNVELPAEVMEIRAQDYPDGTLVEIKCEKDETAETKPCLVCFRPTAMRVNISLTAAPVCESCCWLITKQTVSAAVPK